jgi:hypothetical protein
MQSKLKLKGPDDFGDNTLHQRDPKTGGTNDGGYIWVG